MEKKEAVEGCIYCADWVNTFDGTMEPLFNFKVGEMCGMEIWTEGSLFVDRVEGTSSLYVETCGPGDEVHVSIPINFCPMCGRQLRIVKFDKAEEEEA